MAWQVIILPSAEADLEAMDPGVRRRILSRLTWLQRNAGAIIHHRLSNMPDDLAGLCRLRVGDYRILYWEYPVDAIVKVYRIQHRREVYRGI